MSFTLWNLQNSSIGIPNLGIDEQLNQIVVDVRSSLETEGDVFDHVKHRGVFRYQRNVGLFSGKHPVLSDQVHQERFHFD